MIIVSEEIRKRDGVIIFGVSQLLFLFEKL